MKIVKKILSFILSIVLFILVLAFSLNLVIKGVVQKQIIGGVAKNQILNEYIEKSDYENKDKEKIRKILDNPEALKVANSVVDEYMVYAADNNHKVSKKTVDGIINFFIKNREKLNELTDSNVTEEELKSQETYNNIEKSLNEGFEDVNFDIGEQASNVIRIYSKLTSNNLQILIGISIIIVIILLMIIKSSLYKWMSTFGSSLISTGIMLCGLFFTLNLVVEAIKKKLEFEIEMNLKEVLTIGIIEIVVGIIFIITKIIISKVQIKQTKATVSRPTSTSSESNKIEQPTQPVQQSETPEPVNQSVQQPEVRPSQTESPVINGDSTPQQENNNNE